MTAKKKVLKLLIIIILAIFLFSTGLIFILYLGGSSTGTGEILSGDIAIETGLLDTGIVNTGNIDTGIVNTDIVNIGTVSPIIVGTGNN